MTRRKSAVTATLATAVLGMGLTAAPASAAPSPSSCHGQNVQSFVHEFGGARNAADALIGDYPQAVRDGQSAIRDALCAGEGV
jgi:hypothetical protein